MTLGFCPKREGERCPLNKAEPGRAYPCPDPNDLLTAAEWGVSTSEAIQSPVITDLKAQINERDKRIAFLEAACDAWQSFAQKGLDLARAAMEAKAR